MCVCVSPKVLSEVGTRRCFSVLKTRQNSIAQLSDFYIIAFCRWPFEEDRLCANYSHFQETIVRLGAWNFIILFLWQSSKLSDKESANCGTEGKRPSALVALMVVFVVQYECKVVSYDPQKKLISWRISSTSSRCTYLCQSLMTRRWWTLLCLLEHPPCLHLSQFAMQSVLHHQVLSCTSISAGAKVTIMLHEVLELHWTSLVLCFGADRLIDPNWYTLDSESQDPWEMISNSMMQDWAAVL